MNPKRKRLRPTWRRGLPPNLETLEDRSLMSFTPAVNYAVGPDPEAVVAADFNTDNILDLAAANYANSTVSVLLGNANGTFQAAVNSATGSGPFSLASGDFNEDGLLDVVTANNYQVSVLLGNGDGSFQPPASVDSVPNIASVAVGDFNDDGLLDLGVTSNSYYWGYWGVYYTGYANVLLGNGTGGFSAPITSLLGYARFTDAIVADFNADGHDDLAAISPDNWSASLMLGTGTGTFEGGSSVYVGYYPMFLAAGDFTGDGHLDLTTANLNGYISLLPGDGLGSFGTAQYFTAGSQPQFVATGDFNGDNTLDLAVANGDVGTMSVLLGAAGGSFRPPINVVVGSAPSGIAVGDFNGDGRLDAATANDGSDNVSVLLNNAAWPALTAPSISINDVTVTEGNSGTTAATFTVTLSAAYNQTVSVHYATLDGSATVAGGDYQSNSGTLNFAPNVTTGTITVLVNGDRVGEYSEYFTLLLTDPTNAFVADATAVASITDDEPHVSIDFGPVSVTEGNAGTVNAVFTVRLSNAYDQPVSVNFSTAEGDTEWWNDGWYYAPPAATVGVDFQSNSGSVTFSPNETVKTIPIVVYGDLTGEYDEYFSVNLTSSADATIDAHHAVGIIVDDEPRVSIGNASVVEGNSGTIAMSFTVTLSAAPTAPVSVSYTTLDGSAIAGSDYQAKTDTLSFAIGETSKTITVLVTGDRIGEYDEYLYVNLTAATGGVIANGWGYGSIVDNEPRFNISSASITEGNKGTKLMTFTVTLSSAYDQTVTVNYATQDGSATAGSDYVATSGTLTFAPGQTSKTITVTIKGDTRKEPDEYFYVVLSGASSNSLIDIGTGYGTILNDDGRRGNGKP